MAIGGDSIAAIFDVLGISEPILWVDSTYIGLTDPAQLPEILRQIFNTIFIAFVLTFFDQSSIV
jgi:hypothetical protein